MQPRIDQIINLSQVTEPSSVEKKQHSRIEVGAIIHTIGHLNDLFASGRLFLRIKTASDVVVKAK